MELFNVDIAALIRRHPQDSKNPGADELFWEGRRFPETIKPDI